MYDDNMIFAESAYNYIQTYEIDVDVFELSEKDRYRIEACIYLVDYKKTLRQVEADKCIPRSTLDHWIHKHLRGLSYELYTCVCSQLKENFDLKFKKNEIRRANKNGRKE